MNIFQFLGTYTANNGNIIGQLVGLLFGLVKDYGLTVILFTFFLKLLTLPLEYWQKLVGKKNAVKLKRIQPQLDSLQKKYGDDRNALTLKQQELYKKEGYSPLGACLPMLITMVIMLIMFPSLNAFATYKQIDDFNQMELAYYAEAKTEFNEHMDSIGKPEYKVDEVTASVDYLNAFDRYYLAQKGMTQMPQRGDFGTWEEYSDWLNDWWDARKSLNDGIVEAASKAAEDKYEEIKQSFLWVKNIWRPDTFWDRPVVGAADFQKIAQGQEVNVSEYDLIMQRVSEQFGSAVNGYLILPLLAVALMFFSQRIMSKNSSQGMPNMGEAAKQQQRITQLIMPIMFGIFGLFYTAAVSLYFFMNSLFSILFNFPINALVNMQMKKHEAAEAKKYQGYKR